VGNDNHPGEFDIIARYFAPLAAAELGGLGLSDDAAILKPPPGRELIVTTDTLSAGVHFPVDEDPADIAARLIGVNLSDLAAMGATPWVYTLALALADNTGEDFIKAFADGLARHQGTHAIHLIGGDTVATKGPLTLTLTAIGTVAEGQALRRSGAAAGDDIYVSGTIGDAALGLKVLNGELSGLTPPLGEHLLDRYHRPQPRVALGSRLYAVASAAIDISDGLVADLGHVATASGVVASIDINNVPLSEAAIAAVTLGPALKELAITGGDDYELLFTAPPSQAAAIERLSQELELELSRIGTIDEDTGHAGAVRVIDETGAKISLKNSGYRHF